MIARMLLLLLVILPVHAQENDKEREEARRQKIEIILQYQDRRTLHDGKLVSLLADPDAAVRARAAEAFGSIQDTSVLSLLTEMLTNDTGEAQLAAAFAIGQTAGMLSKKSRDIYEHDLIWARLDHLSTRPGGGASDRIDEQQGRPKMSARGRMIEDIGKFGSETALRDLITRFGETERSSLPLVMSIARFAIRGITTPEATLYILRLCDIGERVPWQAMYALQRIGDKPEVRAKIDILASLFQSRNPLVRMNLATLLGKVKDERSSLLPLQKMADNDGDWRVKVNALKALGNFPLAGKGLILDSFRRAFFSEQYYVALTALGTIGNEHLGKDTSAEAGKLLADLRRIAANKDRGYLWQLQAEASIALAKLEGAKALETIHPTDQAQPKLQAQLLSAISLTGDTGSAATLESFLADNTADIRRAALDGLMELSRKNRTNADLLDRTYAAASHALEERDVAVVTTAASMLGDSLLARPASVGPLLEKLSSLNVPDDVEAIQEVCATLTKLNDRRAIQPLEELLDKPDRAVGQAAADALKSLTGTDYTGRINRSYEPLYSDYDFGYLRSLGKSVRVKIETLRGDIVLELFPETAPFTVMSFLKLATQRGFFRGLSFHRVVPNFVIQGGDPRGDGWGGPGYAIRSEFSPLTYDTGTLGVASAGKDTEGSQFFITQSPQPHLDGRYTIFGKVVSGMDVANRILVDDHIFDIKPLDK